ncbi:MAG: DUF3108 domain-containing protein [Desulfobulbaceae bacterium]|nr:DUF3108 domain-containing protein [Desulfobulbaceae bacterium]
MLRSFLLSTFFVCITLSTGPSTAAAQQELLPSQVVPEALATIFSGKERMHYEVFWSGGMKIGDIYLQIFSKDTPKGAYGISAQIKSTGPLEFFYPVDDIFHCTVRGEMKLPVLYEVFQREGRNRRVTKRVTWYNQDLYIARYQKNDDPVRLHSMGGGTAYNEFAAFVISRALRLEPGSHLVVPTFADNKRNEVAVRLLSREMRSSIFGERHTLKMQPMMNFKGLYEKSGNTQLWITDDQCRVPVEIRSKIAVGALVARLAGYSNLACQDLPTAGRIE